jgi:hypothetical protein
MCSKDRYALVSDFRWLVKTLVALASLPGGCLTAQHGEEVIACLMDVALRVEAIRPLVTRSVLRLMLDGGDEFLKGRDKASAAAALRGSAWIVGEYCDALMDPGLSDPDAGCVHVQLVDTLLHPGVLRGFPASVQRVYVHSAVKVLSSACRLCEAEDLAVIVALLRQRLPLFLASTVAAEVRERASTLRCLLAQLRILPLDATMGEIVGHGHVSSADVADGSGVVVTTEDEKGAAVAAEQKALLSSLLSEKFYAVHPKAQKKVPLPSVSLTAPLNSAALSVLQNSMASLFAGVGGSGTAMQGLTLVEPTAFITGPTVTVEETARSEVHSYRGGDAPSHAGDGDRMRGLTAEEKQVSDALFRDSSSGSRRAHQSSRDRGLNDESSVFMLGSSKPGSSARTSSKSPPAVNVTAHDHQGNIFGADEIEDSRDSRKKASRKSSSKRGGQESSSLAMAVNSTDTLPAGASVDDLGSSDEERMRRRAGASRVKHRDQSNPLASVDITTPLDRTEVLPVLQHRVSTASVARVEEVERGSSWAQSDLAVAAPGEKVHEERHKHKHRRKHRNADADDGGDNADAERKHRHRKHRSKRDGVREGNLIGDM